MKQKRRSLNTADVKYMIQNWDEMSLAELADKFGVSQNTIIMMAKEIRKLNSKVCPPKNRRTKRKDLALNALKELDMLK